MNEVSKLIDRTITEVVLDSTITRIEEDAFTRCTQLATLTIGENINYIDRYAFDYCTSLAIIHCLSTTPPTINNSSVFRYLPSGFAIYVPAESLETYKTASYWSTYKDNIHAYGVADWVDLSYSCEIGEDELYTGYKTAEQEDKNPSSPTYGQTRSGRYEDSSKCSVDTPVFKRVTSLDELTNTTLFGDIEVMVGSQPNTTTFYGLLGSYLSSNLTTSSSNGINSSRNTGAMTVKNSKIYEPNPGCCFKWYNANRYLRYDINSTSYYLKPYNSTASYYRYIDNTSWQTGWTPVKNGTAFTFKFSTYTNGNISTYNSSNTNLKPSSSVSTYMSIYKRIYKPNWVEQSRTCELAYNGTYSYNTGYQIVTYLDAANGVYKTEKVEDLEACPISTEPYYVDVTECITENDDLGNAKQTGYASIYQEDINPNSATFGNKTETEIVDTTDPDYTGSYKCMRSTGPTWVEQSRTCELNEDNLRTGYANVVYLDTWRYSSTYGTTMTERELDTTTCPPEVSVGFTKINSLSEATTGTYLIVNTNVNKALNASLIKNSTNTGGINAADNMIDVTIEDDVIEPTETTLNAAVYYDAANKTLSWTDENSGTTYYLYWQGSGAKFAYSNNTSPSSQYPMEAKEYNGNFVIGNSTRSLAYNTSSPRINFYALSATYGPNMALFKLN